MAKNIESNDSTNNENIDNIEVTTESLKTKIITTLKKAAVPVLAVTGVALGAWANSRVGEVEEYLSHDLEIALADELIGGDLDSEL
ncbi:MAG TPA: hypothetical protein PKD68_04520 [Candidatus Saccharibacteria bacterium]|nr:hypothetical protein [Candidatus Saccharibacteria bacterium]